MHIWSELNPDVIPEATAYWTILCRQLVSGDHIRNWWSCSQENDSLWSTDSFIVCKSRSIYLLSTYSAWWVQRCRKLKKHVKCLVSISLSQDEQWNSWSTWNLYPAGNSDVSYNNYWSSAVQSSWEQQQEGQHSRKSSIRSFISIRLARVFHRATIARWWWISSLVLGWAAGNYVILRN